MTPYQRFCRLMKEFDPSCFADPLAKSIDWNDRDLREGTHGAFHRLVESGPDRMEFKPGPLRIYAIGLCLAIMAMSCVELVRPLLRNPMRFPELEEYAVVPFIAFMAFVGRFVWIGLGDSYTFDRSNRTFFRPNPVRKRWNEPRQPLSDGRFEQIHAVIEIPNFHSGKGGSYVGWSLELLLRDGTRVFLANHCWVRNNREGERLAAFIGVPLWSPDLEFPPELLI